MSKPSYIPFFFDDIDALEPLGDAERGRLLTALLEYGKLGATEKISGNERFVYPMFRGRIDRFFESYEKTCERNKNNIKKRYTKSTTVDGGSERTRSLPSEEEEEEETESKSEAKSNPNTSRASAFDEFWKAYPKKVGKGAAEKAFSKLPAPASLLPKMLDAIELQKQSIQWQKENGQYIPNPSTWLNQRRWEDEPPTEGTTEKGHSAFQELEFENYYDPDTGELKARVKGNA